MGTMAGEGVGDIESREDEEANEGDEYVDRLEFKYFGASMVFFLSSFAVRVLILAIDGEKEIHGGSGL